MTKMIETFQQARTAAIAELDIRMGRLRELVVDPQFCNEMSTDYKQAVGRVQYAINRLIRLNGVQIENDK